MNKQLLQKYGFTRISPQVELERSVLILYPVQCGQFQAGILGYSGTAEYPNSCYSETHEEAEDLLERLQAGL